MKATAAVALEQVYTVQFALADEVQQLVGGAGGATRAELRPIGSDRKSGSGSDSQSNASSVEVVYGEGVVAITTTSGSVARPLTFQLTESVVVTKIVQLMVADDAFLAAAGVACSATLRTKCLRALSKLACPAVQPPLAWRESLKLANAQVSNLFAAGKGAAIELVGCAVGAGQCNIRAESAGGTLRIHVLKGGGISPPAVATFNVADTPASQALVCAIVAAPPTDREKRQCAVFKKACLDALFCLA
jgi:hypothetical protein